MSWRHLKWSVLTIVCQPNISRHKHGDSTFDTNIVEETFINNIGMYYTVSLKVFVYHLYIIIFLKMGKITYIKQKTWLQKYIGYLPHPKGVNRYNIKGNQTKHLNKKHADFSIKPNMDIKHTKLLFFLQKADIRIAMTSTYHISPTTKTIFCINQTWAHQCVGARVKVQPASKCHGSNQLWRGDEGMGGWVGIITTNEVAVVWSDNGVLLAFLYVLSVPLSNAWPTGIGQDCPAKPTQCFSL